MIRNIIYLGYFIKSTDWYKFKTYLKFVSQINNKSSVVIILDTLLSSLKYKISLIEYFQFRFDEKCNNERKKWAGTGYMYEYQKMMNPLKERVVLDDKRLFYKKYRKWFNHTMADLNDLKTSPRVANKLLENTSGKIVFKVADGKCGTAVEIRNTFDFDAETLLKYLQNSQYDLVEEYIIQHENINSLSPSAVNTVRVFSQINHHNEVEILGCRLRISVNSPVDNMAAGNLAAPIDDETGLIYSSAVYSDITKEDCEYHPVTGKKIVGFQVPYWSEIIDMVKEAHLTHPQNRSIGWDIVVTKDGPGFIEGNHDWCKLVWQLPVKKGLKAVLEGHLTKHKEAGLL